MTTPVGPPQPPPTIPKVQLIIDWIKSLGWNITAPVGYPLYPGPETDDIGQDRAVFVTPTPGPGYITEEAALDCWGFQVMVRGPADDPTTPALVIQQFDVMVLNANFPAVVDGLLINIITRSGGTPVPLPLNPQDRRFAYVCTYLITTGLE
jgi:hypothetical protein